VERYQPGKVFIPLILEVEWILSSLSVLKTDLEYDPFGDDESTFKMTKKVKRDDESDEEDREDREYGWKIYKNK
jgi:hypothetical protein